jgi:hypothetical protein
MTNATTTQAPATTTAAESIIKPREFTPKRGIKNVTMIVANDKAEFKPHHQKTLIIELLTTEKEKTMSLADMIGKVEADEKLWKRLNSKQSVFNCITYHMKDLAKVGYLKIKE